MDLSEIAETTAMKINAIKFHLTRCQKLKRAIAPLRPKVAGPSRLAGFYFLIAGFDPCRLRLA